MTSALRSPTRRWQRRFVEHFIRPQGADEPSTPRLADEIEKAARSGPMEKGRHRAGVIALRPLMLAAALALDARMRRRQRQAGVAAPALQADPKTPKRQKSDRRKPKPAKAPKRAPEPATEELIVGPRGLSSGSGNSDVRRERHNGGARVAPAELEAELIVGLPPSEGRSAFESPDRWAKES